jgi:urease accessory protein
MIDSMYSPTKRAFTTTHAGRGALAFRRAGERTVVGVALASSPLRLLLPKNHGNAAWVYLANLGGGMVDGDRIDLRIESEPGTSALIGTQASTKVYRSPRGCSQRLEVHVADGAAIAIVPDPVVCFANAQYAQEVEISLAPTASLVLLEGYTCGRAARGERWKFARFESRTTIRRDGVVAIVDAVRLDPAHGPISERMGPFDVLLSLVAVGPRFDQVREAMLATSARDSAIVATSPVGVDAAVMRIAANRFEDASCVLRPSFAAVAAMLGDDPFARKW